MIVSNEDICRVCGGTYGLHNHMNKACPKDPNANRDHTEYRKTVFAPTLTEVELLQSQLSLSEGRVKELEEKLEYQISERNRLLDIIHPLSQKH